MTTESIVCYVTACVAGLLCDHPDPWPCVVVAVGCLIATFLTAEEEKEPE